MRPSIDEPRHDHDVPCDPPGAGRGPDFLDRLDRSLDPDEDDRRTTDRLKNPFVRYSIIFLFAMLFMSFATYFLSFILKIPLPESEVLKTFMNVLVEFMKVLVP
jgi:hypothetical protein